MELVKSAGKRTSLVSEILYIFFNVGLAVTVFLLAFFGLSLLSYAVVVLSKWRVLAVRPRFWWANVKANLLDLLLGLSIVAMMIEAGGTLWLQILLTILYSIWLVVIKPRSGQSAVLTQAAVAQFMAIVALYTVSFDWYSWVVVGCMWIIGYISAQHALSSFEDSDVTFLSLIWGLLVAEMGWLGYNWAIAYAVSPNGALKIPQIAVIVTLISFVAMRAYGVFSRKKKLRLSDITVPTIFSLSIVMIILIFFNDITRG